MLLCTKKGKGEEKGGGGEEGTNFEARALLWGKDRAAKSVWFDWSGNKWLGVNGWECSFQFHVERGGGGKKGGGKFVVM